MDLDGLIRRAPAVALVDELAHRNIPGSRHPRRYQDIEELLEHGIDVWTTLNIQHLESLNDAVARITGVRMRETVPDALLSRAGDVVLVDLTPRGADRAVEAGQGLCAGAGARRHGRLLQPIEPGGAARACPADGGGTHRRGRARAMREGGIQGPWRSSRALVAIDGVGNSEEVRCASASAWRNAAARPGWWPSSTTVPPTRRSAPDRAGLSARAAAGRRDDGASRPRSGGGAARLCASAQRHQHHSRTLPRAAHRRAGPAHPDPAACCGRAPPGSRSASSRRASCRPAAARRQCAVPFQPRVDYVRARGGGGLRAGVCSARAAAAARQPVAGVSARRATGGGAHRHRAGGARGADERRSPTISSSPRRGSPSTCRTRTTCRRWCSSWQWD